MSQGSYNVPTGGSFSMVTFAGLMNAAYDALATNGSGSSAPANGPGNAPLEFQSWFDTTSVNFPALKFFDGVNWNRSGILDVANSNWLPKMGGGTATLASASTVDIGNSPQSFITITGVVTINGFGTAATVGEERKLQFTGNLQITYNAAAIVTPALANINTQPGDTCHAIYEGGGIWTIWGYVRATSASGFALPTGAAFWMPTKNVAINGAVRANGLTIGSAASAATELASGTTVNLYTFLWNNLPDTICPVSGGRGATAAADFAANKPMGLPDMRGRVMAGLDDMGNAAASRLTSLTMSPDGTTAFATGGGQSVTFLQANLPSLNWPVTDPGHIHNLQAGNFSCIQIFALGFTTSNFGGPQPNATTVQSATTGISVASGGSGTAVKIMQPTAVGTVYICL